VTSPGTRRRIAVEELTEPIMIVTKVKDATAELKAFVTAGGSRMMTIYGVGPVVAARILADVGDVGRFANRNRFASWTRTAPLVCRLVRTTGTGCRGLGTGG
jgi:transposase